MKERRNGKGGLFSWSLRLSDIPAEHKYHSLTVICHFNTDVWSLNSKPLIHIPGHKTQGQFKYGPAGPGMTGYPSLPPSLPLSLSPSLPPFILLSYPPAELRCRTIAPQMNTFPATSTSDGSMISDRSTAGERAGKSKKEKKDLLKSSQSPTAYSTKINKALKCI